MKSRTALIATCGALAILVGGLVLALHRDSHHTAGASPTTTATARATGVATTPTPTPSIVVPTGTEAVAVDIASTPGGAGYFGPGDLVDVMVVTDNGSLLGQGSTQATETLLQHVKVLDVSATNTPARLASGAYVSTSSTVAPGATSTTTASAPTTAAVPTTLTYLLAVPAGDAERLVQAAAYHHLYLSLPAKDATTRPPVTVTDANLGGA